MAKKWAISDAPPLKVRLVKTTEGDGMEKLVDCPTRVRTISRRIVKVLVLLWALCIGSWLQACHHATGNDGVQQDAIDGQDNPFGMD